MFPSDLDASAGPTTRRPAPTFQPTWLAAAWREFGERERSGPAANPRIIALYRDAGHPSVRHDEVAWCAAFVGAVLKRSGFAPTGSLMARSYLVWGEPLVEPRLGAVAVFSRGSDRAAGHVGFLLGETPDALVVLGGNQSDAVTVAAIPRARLIGLRWPVIAAPTPAPAVGSNAGLFATALAHVLRMEGGYSDDPLDPGGPTNRGITLADLSRHRATSLTPASRASLIADLRAIAPSEVEAIYQRHYWRPACCDALPPAIALFHFDTAVNMGVGTAARMLQTALGVEIDGEIGPQTLAAAATIEPGRMLAVYADLRRHRYRSLATFPRFGRGWLARVDKTLATAAALQASPKPKGPPMTTSSNDTAMPADPKWWGNSVTVWGAIVTGLAAVLPAVGPALGVDIPKEAVTDGAAQIGAIVQAATGLAGTLLTIFGRLRAKQPLARRAVTLHI